MPVETGIPLGDRGLQNSGFNRPFLNHQRFLPMMVQPDALFL